MKWLQLSDLHFSSEVIPGADTQLLRRQLLKYLKNVIGPVDYIFLTGDFRFGGQPQMPNKAYDWILSIADAVQINNIAECVFMVPGNHDVNRSEGRGIITKCAMQNYDAANGVFDSVILKTLLQDFSYYDSLYQKIYGKSYINESIKKYNPHSIKDCGNFYLVMLNTALLSNQDGERGYLLTGTGHVASLNPSDEKPVVVLGHHGLGLINLNEQEKLKLIFKEWNVKAYLCGDAHRLSAEYLGKNSYQITCGCLLKNAGIVDIAFTVGELIGQEISITAHEWRDNWTINPHFGNQGVLVIGQDNRNRELEPKFCEYLKNEVKNCEKNDIQIHTPQILLILLQYPGSILKRILNQYTMNIRGSTEPFGDYLCQHYNRINIEQKKQGMHFNWGIDWEDLLGIKIADTLRQKNKFPYITENLIAYAVLSSERITVKELQKVLGKTEFDKIKQKLLNNGTVPMFAKLT